MGTPIEPGNVQGNDAPGQNPAWNDVLSVIPQDLHDQVTPHFQQWDQSAQSQIEKANNSVKEFEPYRQFVDNGIEPGELEQGLRLMYEINTNPQSVYDALAEAYGLNSGQGNGNDPDDEGNDPSGNQNFQDPRYDELQQNVNLLGEALVEQHQQKLSEQADVELDNELSALRQQHGEFDEQYVLALMLNGKSGSEAVTAYQQLTENLLQNNPRPFAPNIMGNSPGGSGLPSQSIDPTKLSGKDTRSLVTQMLEAAKHQT